MNESSNYESEEKMMLKAFFIILGVLAIIFSSFLTYYYFKNEKTKKESIKESLKEPLTNYEIEKVDSITDGYMLVETKNNKLILNEKGKLIEQFEKNTNINLIYDGYYILTHKDYNLIKREGQEVTKMNATTGINAYKKDDAKTYIISTKYTDSYEISKINDQIAYINSYSNKTSILYNYLTGKIMLTTEGLINRVYINKEMSEAIIAISCTNNENIKIYNIIEKKFILENKDYKLQNEPYEDCGSDIYFTNSKYIIIEKENKYGMIDYNGNIVISQVYDEMIFDSNNQTYAAGKLNDNYFLIDIDKKVMLPFSYDYIKVLNNYIVVTKDGELNIFDSKLNKINTEPYNTDNRLLVDTNEQNIFSTEEYARILKVTINDLSNSKENDNKLYYKEIIVTPSNEIIIKDKISNKIDGLYFVKDNDEVIYYILYNNNKISIYDKESLLIGSIEDVKNLDTSSIYLNNEEIYINNNIVYSIKENNITKNNEEASKYIEKQIDFSNNSNIKEYNYYYDGTYININKDNKYITKIKGNAIIEIKNGYFLVRDLDKIWKIYKLI